MKIIGNYNHINKFKNLHRNSINYAVASSRLKTFLKAENFSTKKKIQKKKHNKISINEITIKCFQ